MKSRTYNVIRNTASALISQGAASVLTFITRTVFINQLGKTYLGLNGLFSDILSLLSLAELGIGTAIIYSMYKPMAESDERKVSALMRLYGKIYTFIGLFVTGIGLCVTPFLSYFISDMPNIPELSLIYLLYLFNTTFSYFFVYKKSILIVTQNSHILSITQILTAIIQNVVQICVLIVFKDFIIYLIIQVVCVLLNNILMSIYVDRKYRFLQKYKDEKVDSETKREIKKNVAAMFLSKVSSAIVTSTDSLLISGFVSTILLGVYSNYTLFINLIRQIFTKIFESITGSVGNLVTIEEKEKSYEIYQNIFFVNFWMISFCSIMLFVNINPFINLWLGKPYLLKMSIVFIICLNLYMRFIRDVSLVFIDTYGLFWNIKWKCVAEAVLNLAFSLFYLKYLHMGIFGVLLGTLTSNVLTNIWYEPYVIYRYKFHQRTKSYFLKFASYLFVTLFIGGVLFELCNIIVIVNKYVDIVVDIMFGFIFVNGMITIIYRNTNEFKYFISILKRILKRKGVNTVEK